MAHKVVRARTFRPVSLVGALTVSLALLGSPVITSSLGSANAAGPDDSESTRRLGVIALASAISAVGQTPELSTPLPFTTTSLADVLDLDEQLTKNLDDALTGEDLALGLAEIPGIEVLSSDDTTLSFTYSQTVDDYALPLVHDDGDLRFGPNDGAGKLDVSLTTDVAHPFVVQVDPTQTDPLLKVALVSQPELDLDVSIDKDHVDPFTARQGFTEIKVNDGHYKIHRHQDITMRDPDGRSLLTLEDLRYSTLPDLFRITTGTPNTVDVGFDIALPDSLTGGGDSERSGTMAVTKTSAKGKVWPEASDATRTYGTALEQATGLSMVDGLTGLAQYTGTALALQDAANVDFPNLGGGTSDLFSPGDRLLDLLSTAAAAQVQCGVAPQLPPAGVAAPGDTVYCTAKTPDGLGTPDHVVWKVRGDNGTIVTTPKGALGPNPTALVRIDKSDGEPDVQVSFTAKGQNLTARSMPHTVQDVMARIGELGSSSASASLGDGRLDVSVQINQGDSIETDLPLGNADGLGALVGLTGLKSSVADDPAEATTTASGASFTAGFGIQTGTPDATGRTTYLLPGSNGTLLKIDDLAADSPPLGNLDARIGFLKVSADLESLTLGHTGDTAVKLSSKTTAPVAIDKLLTDEGALDPTKFTLLDAVTAGISFTATEKSLGSSYASGATGPASGSASVAWSPAGLPKVTFGDGYNTLRVFDPVPARFLSGTAHVTSGADGDQVRVDLPSGSPDLYDDLGVADPDDGGPAKPEVARRLLAGGPACQTVTVLDADSFTCTGLAPGGVAAFGNGDPVQAIVVGDPFALRDSVIEGLSSALASFNRIDGDNITDSLPDDQYNSTLPLVDLRPAQLAVERDALTKGLSRLSSAATEDEAGDNRSSSLPSVSSAQELEDAIGALVGTKFAPSLSYSLDDNDLGISVTADSPSGATLKAPLRLMALPGQVVSEKTYDVGVDSTTTLAVNVDVHNARPATASGTGTSSTATLALPTAGSLAGAIQAGVGSATVKASGSSAVLGVSVDTAYDDVHRVFKTTRSNARAGLGDDKPAALATLVTDDSTIDYSALATDSSGGGGAVQPVRVPMQVEYLAEGLDGLASALGEATDGAAPRNIGPDGAPISAPLIGSDLDAGAEVSKTLTGLTSKLRDELGKSAVKDAADAGALTTALEGAVATAVSDTSALEDVDPSDVTVTVECGSDDGTCDPDECVEPTDDEPNPPPCETDESTGWDVVSVGVTLTGAEKSGHPEFQTGLAGLAVRSEQEIDTTTSWTLPITLRLTRGVGPQVVINDGDALELDVQASLPDLKDGSGKGIDAIVGYLPATLTPTDDGAGDLHTVVNLALGEGSGKTEYDLFDLYDGKLKAKPSFTDPDPDDNVPGDETNPGWDDGLSLDFETDDTPGAMHLKGTILMPWSADGFGDVAYNEVQLDVGDVINTMATPFNVIDPYLAPVRDVIDVLRTPIPVVSDLSELAGGDEVSLLSIVENLSDDKPALDIAYRVIDLIDGVAKVNHAISEFGKKSSWVDLQAAADAAAVLTVEPSEVAVYGKCTETIKTTKTNAGSATTPPTSTTRTTKPEPCPDEDAEEAEQEKPGVAGQTAQQKRVGKRDLAKTVTTQKTKDISASVPGFSLPFLEDPNQIMDVLTGAGEATYFRVDFGTLAASVAYTQKFGPIMAGPVPIVPFVGGSISIEGRLAMGFDSYAQTLAYQALPNPGDVTSLRTAYTNFDGGDVIKEGFYLDDLDSDGIDVPEAKLVTTLEAGAGVSIGIVSAGLKGSITLTINLDLNDPNEDGKLRTAEIRNRFGGNPICAFEASGELEAGISIFVEIDLLIETLSYEFDLLRLGPYELFHYSCPKTEPALVVQDGTQLALTSGKRVGSRGDSSSDGADEYEVRQFDTGGGAAGGKADSATAYEVAALGLVQRVEVTPKSGGGYLVRIFKAGVAISSEEKSQFNASTPPDFAADGGDKQDKLSFLTGENFDDAGELVSTPFSTDVADLTGGDDNDLLVTGSGDDAVNGGSGDDSIDTGAGDDSVNGGANNDIINGGAGNDDLVGDTGDDHLEGGAGADRASGGDGNDSLQGGPGRDVRAVLIADSAEPDIVTEQVLAGFDSGDVLVGNAGADTVDGGDGSDVVVGGDASALTGGGLGSLLHDGDRAVKVITRGGDGTVTSMTVTVPTAKTPTDDELDELCVSGTADTGADIRDFVTGGPEADVVVGGNGPDTLDGGSGPDEICGRAAADQISGDGAQTEDDGHSNDVIRGGTGDDQADGGPGDDVMYGDDATLVRDGSRHLDGSLGASGGTGTGKDYLQGGLGNDILAGEGGSDLLIGEAGDDQAFGEGSDTDDSAGDAPSVADRLLACNTTTRVIDGMIDLNGDLLAGAGGSGVVADTGQLSGLRVVDGKVRELGASTDLTGLLGGDVVVIGGLVDLDHDGSAGSGDTGMIPFASMLDTTGSNTAGDCILAGDGNDELSGGHGSDYLGAGNGTDLAVGGDGNDLMLGDDGTDVLLGGTHNDVLVGGLGDDRLQGGNGDDRLRGNEGADDLIGGSATSGADDGQDVLLGGREKDVLVAENGSIYSPAINTAVGSSTVPWRGDSIIPSDVQATSAPFTGSALACGTDNPNRWLTLLTGDGVAGVGVSSPGVDDVGAYDELYGGFDCDFVFGSTGNDEVRGGQDSDVVEAGPGADYVYGDDGDDVVIGGSSYDPSQDTAYTVTRTGGSAAPDGGDTIHGDRGADSLDGSDLVMGDNALPTRLASPDTQPGPDYTIQLLDVATTTVTPASGTSGGDTIDTGGSPDRVYGQGGNDAVDAGNGDDYVEGNEGTDSLVGQAGNDVLIGGSSMSPNRDGTLGSLPQLDVLDGADQLYGDNAGTTVAGSDLLLGDNATVLPVGARTVVQLAQVPAGSTAPAGTSGGDTIVGGGPDTSLGAPDQAFGQGGDDTITTAGGTDYVEGNDGADTLSSGRGDDDVIGGSSANDGRPLGDVGTRLAQVLDAAPYDASAAGVLDGNDTITGGTGADYLLGDNGRITRPPNRARDVGLTDTAAGAWGNDRLFGGDDNDRLFGEDGTDELHAGIGDDYAEGNQGFDTIYGDGGADTVIGGSSVSPASDAGSISTLPTVNASDSGDFLYGDDDTNVALGSDLIMGDNATVLWVSGRPVVQLAQVPDSPTKVVTGLSGNDTIVSGGLLTLASDTVFGQGGDDTIRSGAAPDYLEGNDGLDTVWSGSGNDTVIGGSSANDGRPLGTDGLRLTEGSLPLVATGAAGVRDEADTVYAGAGDDAVLGDNGRITRPTTGPNPSVAMADLGGANSLMFGSDQLFGEDGKDDLYGQLDDGTATLASGDRLYGGADRDSLVGDLAVVVRKTAASLNEKPRQVALNSDAIVEDLYPANVDIPTAVVPTDQATVGGPDLLLGGDGDDLIRGGGGKDIANGGAGGDVVLGGDADDALWGGVGHDRIFGGYGDDDLDLKIRTGDPDEYALGRDAVDSDGTESTSNGPDMIYGGWGADELQVDVGGAGKTDTNSDHVVDWVGAHNVYYVCGGAYGAGRVVRQQSPAMIDLVNQLVLAAGDRDVATNGSGGFYDLGIVPSQANSQNSSPSPEAPGHFTCG